MYYQSNANIFVHPTKGIAMYLLLEFVYSDESRTSPMYFMCRICIFVSFSKAMKLNFSQYSRLLILKQLANHSIWKDSRYFVCFFLPILQVVCFKKYDFFSGSHWTANAYVMFASGKYAPRNSDKITKICFEFLFLHWCLLKLVGNFPLLSSEEA